MAYFKLVRSNMTNLQATLHLLNIYSPSTYLISKYMIHDDYLLYSLLTTSILNIVTYVMQITYSLCYVVNMIYPLIGWDPFTVVLHWIRIILNALFNYP